MIKAQRHYYQYTHKWLDHRSVKHQYSGEVSEDASPGFGLSALLSPLSGLVGGLFSPTAPDPGSPAGGNGAYAPSETAGGPFGIGAKTLPGSVGNPNSPVYANTLQFGPIPGFASTSVTPLTPMAAPVPTPGPTIAGGGMGGGGMMSPVGGGGAPQIVTPGMSAGGGPLPPQMQMLPQMANAPQMPFLAPFDPNQSTQPPPQASSATFTPAAPSAPQVTPWQAAAMNQMQQAGLSPAAMSQATMPTVLSGTITGGEPATPPPPPNNAPAMTSPQTAAALAPQMQQYNQAMARAMPGTPEAAAIAQKMQDAGGNANMLMAATAYPQMLAQSLDASKENVGSFNKALLQGSKDINEAADTVREGLMAPAAKEVNDLLNTPRFPVTYPDGRREDLTLPEYRKRLQAAVQANNEDIEGLIGQSRNIGLDRADIEHANTIGGLSSAFPKGQQKGIAALLSNSSAATTLGARHAAIASAIAQREQQTKGLMAQDAELVKQVDAVRDRYQKAQQTANNAAGEMRKNYYQAADTMLGGVKGINELQAQTIRGYIADQQHQGMVEQQATANALTRSKMEHEAELKGLELEEKAKEAGQKGYAETQKQQTALVNDMMKKLKKDQPPAYYAKALKDFMDQTSIHAIAPAETTGLVEAKK